MEEKKENLIVRKESENFMQYENKNVEINGEIRNMETNTNYVNVEQQKDTELNYVHSVSIDGLNNKIPSTRIISQYDVDTQLDDNWLSQDKVELCDTNEFFSDSEDSTEFNAMWDSIVDVYQELSQDEVIYKGILLEPMESKTFDGDTPTLDLPVSVNDGGVIKKVKYTTYFPRNNSGFLYYEMLRLKKTLLALGITDSMIQGNKNPKNIAIALKPFVGKEIKISQYKQDGYNKYKIHGLVGGGN
ncbi:MAG: hypothetical protein OSJ63_04010 [Bacilli bacterium]|nr:hypothetical protein [Bacilli bacterium]